MAVSRNGHVPERNWRNYFIGEKTSSLAKSQGQEGGAFRGEGKGGLKRKGGRNANSHGESSFGLSWTHQREIIYCVEPLKKGERKCRPNRKDRLSGY